MLRAVERYTEQFLMTLTIRFEVWEIYFCLKV